MPVTFTKGVKMFGAPSVYATRQDYYNTAKIYPKEAAKALQQLMDGRFIWQETGELSTREAGRSDEDHKVIQTEREVTPGSQDKKMVFIQMEKVEDQNAEFFRMGWTVSTALGFISDFGGQE